MELKIRKCANAKEALEKKKKAKLGMLISLGVAAVFSLVSGFVEPLKGVLGTVGALALLPSVFFIARFILLRNEVIRLNNTQCPKCHSLLRYEDAQYIVTGSRTTSNKTNNGHINKCTVTGVDFTCTCGNCGEVHKFHYSFITEEQQTNVLGAVLKERTYNLEDKIKELF